MFLAEKQIAEKTNRLLFKLQTKLEPLSFTPLKCKKFNALFYKSNVNELFSIDLLLWTSQITVQYLILLLHLPDNIIVNCQNYFITICYIL